MNARPRFVKRSAVALAALITMATSLGCAAMPGARPAVTATARVAVHSALAARAVDARSVSQARARGAAAGCNPEAASLAPLGPPRVTAGSFMAKIRARGFLIAGVDQSTYHFGYLNPLDGQIEGFDIDMEIGRAHV